MFYRHLLAFFITAGIYYVPDMIYSVNSGYSWINSALWSLIYIVMIYKCAKIRIASILICIEMAAMLTTFIANYQYRAGGGLFYDQYESILNTCYVMELITIGAGMLRGGIIKRLHTLCITIAYSRQDSHCGVLFGKKHL
jgi:hypothetical protein